MPEVASSNPAARGRFVRSVLLGGACLGIAVSTWALGAGQIMATGLAWSFIVVETAITFWVVAQLDEITAAETKALRNLKGVHDSSLLEAASEVLHTAYSTASNGLFVVGMLGAAAHLLASSRGGETDDIILVAPRAFSATAFGLFCGLLVAVYGQFNVLDVRRDHLSRVGLVAPARGEFDGLTNFATIEALLREGLASESAWLSAVKAQAADIAGLRGDVGTLLAQQAALRPLQQAALTKVVEGLGGAENRSLVEQLSQATAAVDRSNAGHLALTQNLVVVGARIERLRGAISEESRALLDRHAALLSDQTLELARVSLASIGEAAKTSVGDRLDELMGDFAQRVADIHDSANKTAQRHLTNSLGEALQLAAGLGTSLQAVVVQLSDATQGVKNLAASLKTGGDHAGDSVRLYQQAVASAEAAAERLAGILATPPDETSEQTLVHTLAGVCDALASVLGSLGTSLDELRSGQERLARARSILARRFLER